MSDIKDQIIDKQEELLKHYRGMLREAGYYIQVKGEQLVSELASLKSQALQERGEIRDELIKFESRFDKYRLTNIRNTEISSYLEMLKKEHERSVDDYLKSKQSDPTPDLC